MKQRNSVTQSTSPLPSPASSRRSLDEQTFGSDSPKSVDSDISDASFRTTSSFNLLAAYRTESNNQPESEPAVPENLGPPLQVDADSVFLPETKNEDDDKQESDVEAVVNDGQNDLPVLLINGQPLSNSDLNRLNKVSIVCQCFRKYCLTSAFPLIRKIGMGICWMM